jgi:hypothetical protein
MSVDLARAEKQKYLREHILEKGYEIEKFVSYMQGLRGTDWDHRGQPLVEGGDDIDVWSFEEIKDIVDRFVERSGVEKPKPTPKNGEEDKEKNSSAAGAASSGTDGTDGKPAPAPTPGSVVPKMGETTSKKKSKASCISGSRSTAMSPASCRAELRSCSTSMRM